jgi:hypothetical protein
MAISSSFRQKGISISLRTSLILSLQGIIHRNYGFKLNFNDVKMITEDRVAPILVGQEDLELSGRVSKETIDFLSGKILALTIMLETGSVDRFPKVGDYVSYYRKVPTGWISNGKKKHLFLLRRSLSLDREPFNG